MRLRHHFDLKKTTNGLLHAIILTLYYLNRTEKHVCVKNVYHIPVDIIM